jgi:hypothetical protein
MPLFQKLDSISITSNEDRSVVIRGLPLNATLTDVAKIVRGGLILNMFIRSQDRTAHVAFAEPDAAGNFFVHSKRNALYIGEKRVSHNPSSFSSTFLTRQIEVCWDRRQYSVPSHLARRVRDGATRNLVVRFIKDETTVDSVRQHLEHIHRLEVVDISIQGGHLFISTNAIIHAVTARNCMASRLEYKGHRIDFSADECAEPLSTTVNEQRSSTRTEKLAGNWRSNKNRFAPLGRE